MIRRAWLASLFLLAFLPAVASAQALLIDGLGGSRGFGTDCLSPNDDGSSAVIDLSTAFPGGLEFFGRRYTTFHVNTNGNITFDGSLSTFTPDSFPVADQPMIAPYWADVDIRGAACSGFGGDLGCSNPSTNGVWWHLESGRVVVTWDQVGHFSCEDTEKMSFQVVLTEGRYCGVPGDFDVEFRYNRCEWEVGSASGDNNDDGVCNAGDDPDCTPAQVGFDAGNLMDFVSIMGSRMNGIRNRVCMESNVGIPGVWRFQIRRGEVSCPDSGMSCDTGEMGVCGEGRTQCVGAGTECQQVLEPGDETCNGADDDCDGMTDEGDALCPDLQLCHRGACIDPCFEGGCGEGEVCTTTGVCAEVACEDVVCDPGQRCIGGACTSACDAVVCPSGQTCRLGTCQDLCDTVSCDACQVCIDGSCLLHCVVRGCPVGQTCEESGECVEESCLGVRCGPGRACRGGTCRDSCEGVACPTGQVCRVGECIPRSSLPDGGPEPDGGPPADSGAGADAGPMAMDGGLSDGGIDPGDPGCGCRAAGSPSSSSGWLGLAFALALLVLRRRRRGLRDARRAIAAPLALGAIVALFATGCETGGCGDGAVLIPERCDDGNTAEGDGCSATCVEEPGWLCTGAPSTCEFFGEGTCGDGTVNPGEDCDAAGETGACDFDCTFALCGDSRVNMMRGETCDDGNLTDGDGCSSMCQVESVGCGNGACDPDETCTGCPLDCADAPRCRECLDMDGDGFTDSACGGPDCNDFDISINPDATEVPCNRVDEDCNPATVDALDVDGDLSSCNYDCDDEDPSRSPLFFERCGNGIDDDCNPATSDVGDNDGDGFACDADCNDFDATVCPTCPEICANIIDDDCDPSTLDLFDADGDGSSCNLDCADDDSAVFPGQPEICSNGVDDDCDPSTIDLFDGDMDGDACDTDCDDRDARRATTFSEICGNGFDDDCDGATLDMEDRDSDTYFCDIDCNDMNASVFPDAFGFCGPRFTYSEGFESGPGGWTTSGTASSWAYGTPAATFISGAATGTKAWVTNLTGNYRASEMSYLTSPLLDFSTSATDPILRFNHIFRTESCCDEGWVEVSTDGGTVWRKVGTRGSGTNWYNSASNYWNGSSGASGAWRTAQHVLTGTAGMSNVRVRFVFSSDSSIHDEGFGVDDVVIDNQILDLATISAGVPEATCRSASHPIAVRVQNRGSVTVSSFSVSYTLDTGAPVTEAVTRTLRPGEAYTHLFTARANLDTVGAHTILGRVTTPMDADASNDALAAPFTVQNVPFVVLGAGYTEGFESSAGGWSASGTSSSWARGTPSGVFITGAASGTQAWVTSLSGDYNDDELSYLTSPCFDMTATASDPTLSFAHIYRTDFFGGDEGYVEILSTTSGTWTRLGAAGEGTNWYSDSFNDSWNGSSGATGAWETAIHVLDGAAGSPIVRIRHVMTSDFLFGDEGFGVDDVRITP